MSEDRWDYYLKRLQLTQELDTEHYKAFRMAQPGTRAGSMRIVFTPEGIAIMGDLVPLRNGVISNLGYGLGWFCEPKSESYLCEKFLSEEFVPEIAQENLKDHVKHSEDYGWSTEDVETAIDLIARLENNDLSEHEFYETMSAFDPDFVTDGCGRGYNPRDAGLLCAINKRFAELYAEFVKETASEEPQAPGK